MNLLKAPLKEKSTVNHFKFIFLITIISILNGCKSNINIKLKNIKSYDSAKSLNITISNIQVINNQIIITGTNLSSVSNFNIKEGGSNIALQIESKNSTSLIANTLSNVTFVAGKFFDFILSNANAAATFNVNFSLCDSTLGGMAFDCNIIPTDKQVLSYDANSGKWKPRNVNGLDYIGAWDPVFNGGVNPNIELAGHYYIVNVSGTMDSGATILRVGDWIVSDGSSWQKIDNSIVITSVFSRTGNVVATEGDYELTTLGDVTITSPLNNQILKYNGSTWVNSTETDPNVSAFAKATLPTCVVGEVLKSDGTSLSCVVDNSGVGSFSGTANRALVTDASGEITVSSISSTGLGYLSGVTSNIQTQLDGKQSTSTFVDWSDSGVATLEPTRLNLTTANRVVITNGTSTPIASTVTTTDLGYISGVTSSIQTQLDAKQSVSTFPANVRATTLTGLSILTNAVVTTGETIVVAIGYLQKQIIDLGTTKLSYTGGIMSSGTIDGIPNPTTANQVANKGYVDSVVNQSSVNCPSGYILVPGNTTYFPKQFCVAKYEAKNDGYGTAVSTAVGTPWINNTRAISRTKCQNLGSGYDMISNDQWQTIARNIAGVAENWSTGTIASGELNRGHSDVIPNNSLAAVIDDNDPCNGTGETCNASNWSAQRRTHALSNGNKIWDFAGNVWEFVTNDSSVSNGTDGYISTMSSGDIRQTRYGALGTTICATPGVSPYCGMGNGLFNYSSGSILRGGNWNNNVDSGIFSLTLNASGAGNSFIGFRCVFVP